MKHVDDERLNMRIESFLERKHQQYPELSLRGNEKRAESIGYVVMDKFFELMTRRRVAKIISVQS